MNVEGPKINTDAVEKAFWDSKVINSIGHILLSVASSFIFKGINKIGKKKLGDLSEEKFEDGIE